MVLPGTGSHSPLRQSLTTPCTVAMASGVSCHSGFATTSRRVPRWSTASSENFLATAFQASQSVFDCHGGEMAGLNECTNGCMSVVLMSCFSYQVAAGSTTSENSVELVIRKSMVMSRSSLPSGTSSGHAMPSGRLSGGACSAVTALSVPSRCLRKYSLPLALEPSRLARHRLRMRGWFSSASGSSTANFSAPDLSWSTT